MLINIGNNENEEKIAITVIQNSGNEDLYEYYKKLINECKIDIFVSGDINNDNINPLIEAKALNEEIYE